MNIAESFIGGLSSVLVLVLLAPGTPPWPEDPLPVGGLEALEVSESAGAAYPLDGFEHTGIRRLLRTRLIAEGKLPGRKPPPGALKSYADITLHLKGVTEDPLDAAPDPDLQQKLAGLFKGRDPSYSVALADITPGGEPRLALHRADGSYQPGSVGKLAVAAGLFTELARLYPNDTESRRRLLKERTVRAGGWANNNHHTIPVYDPDTGAFQSRAVRESDVFSLYEWTDHALSASSNAAASVLWKEVLLMRAYGASYPPTADEEARFFRETPRDSLSRMGMSVVNAPIQALGISPDDWHLGSLFTTQASRWIPARGGSRGTPRALLTFLVRMEQGRIVDPWSSLELKRLMYATERRIRYAAAPVLADAAVYYKSGSLYRCREEAGPDCGQYRGNVFNYMNSVGIVEAPDGRVYLVAFMSNVLRVNSAGEHSRLATELHRMLGR